MQCAGICCYGIGEKTPYFEGLFKFQECQLEGLELFVKKEEILESENDLIDFLEQVMKKGICSFGNH